MAAMSDYLEAGLLNYIFRAAAAPTMDATNIWIALLTAAPDDAGNGTEVSTSGTNYARKAVVRNTTGQWDAPSAGANPATQNTGAITFNTPSGAWGTVSHFGIYKHATSTAGTDLLFHGALTQSKTIGGTDPAPSFAAGAFDIALTGAWSEYLAQNILNWVFRNGTLATFTASLHVSLHSGAPSYNGANEFTVANGYGRVAVTRTPGTSAGWGVGGANTAVTTGGAISNNEQINFGSPSGGNWGTATDAGIWDASTSGNFLFASTMTDKTINNGDAAPYIANNSLTITLA